MNIMKRILTLLLALTLVLGMAMPVFAAEVVASGTCGSKLTWTLDSDGTLTISGTGSMTNYLSVSQLPWYSKCTSIKSAVIGSGVTSIGNYAFYNCSSLTSITLPEGVTSIGRYAFQGCSSLTSITIPDSVTSIDNYAFCYCSNLTDITIPDSVTSIGSYAFKDCSSLTSITIPDSVTSIDNNAFQGCSSLTSITLPDSVTSIGSYAFRGCSSLTGITIPKSVTIISRGAFYDCSSLTSITLPEGVTSIGDEAFQDCSSLTSITLPEGVTSIGDYTFYGCSSLTSITIPDSVTSIGSSAFKGCSSLTKITFSGFAPSFGDGVFDNVTATVYYPAGNVTWTEEVSQNYGGTITWKPYAAAIPSGTCGNKLIWTLDNNGTLTISGSGMMWGYNGNYQNIPWYNGREFITKIVIEEGVTSIGNRAFSGCSNLTDITIPDSVTFIGDNAFYSCSSLTSITLPDSVSNVGRGVFFYCDNLTSIKLSSSISFIGDSMFYFCRSLTTITIPEGVAGIGDFAFSYCSSLTSITLPECLTSIGSSAFNGCSSLTSVTLPKGLTSIGKYAFSSCSSLTAITLPECLTSIGEYAFSSCSSLTTIRFRGDAPTFLSSPSFDSGSDIFSGVTATAYYPANNKTWTAAAMRQYDGNITWVPYLCETPDKPYKITNVVSGIHVYWKAVDGAAKYGLWRSETGINGTYKWVANPTVPHFTDTKAESGKTYYYKVTAMDNSGKHTDQSPAIGITFVSTPDISARYNKAAGIKLDWKKVPGATGYAIYRKSYSGSDAWVRVGTISGNTTFTWTDTSVKNNNGTAYKYTIRALAGSNMKTLSGCRNAGRSMVRLTSRTLTGATETSISSIKCSWNTSAAVTGYEVRFMVGNTVYKTFTVGNCKIGTKIFTGLKAGHTYKIQVRSYKKIDGMGFYSAWSAAKEVKLGSSSITGAVPK